MVDITNWDALDNYEGLRKLAAAINDSIRILEAEVTISSAQILALLSTPVVLVPSPGAGLAIVPVGFIYRLLYGTSPYTYGSNNVRIYYGDNSRPTANSGSILHGALSASSSTVVTETSALQAVTALIDNQQLVLAAISAGPSGGDSVLRILVSYRIIQTT